MTNACKFLLFTLIVCGGRTLGQNKFIPSSNKLSCILLGYDSMACYYGNSTNMVDLRSGRISDTSFIHRVVEDAKFQMQKGSLSVAIKPTEAGDVAKNFTDLVNILNENELSNRQLDTLDQNEERIFSRTTLKPILEKFKDKQFASQFPKDLNVQADSIAKTTAIPDKINIFLFNNNGIYTCTSGDLTCGKRCTYQELKDYLSVKCSNNNPFILIKPCKSTSYKNIVDMMDVMTKQGVKKYALMDITNAEEDYISHIR